MNDTAAAAYAAHLAADEAWMDEIRRAFPRLWAGDVRYTDAAHGWPGSDLRAAYDEFLRTRALWEAHLRPEERTAA